MCVCVRVCMCGSPPPSPPPLLTLALLAQQSNPKTIPQIRRLKSANQTTTSQAKAHEHLLSLVPILHARFARYDEVDQAQIEEFEEQVKRPPPIQPHEDTLITASVGADDAALDEERLAVLREMNPDATLAGAACWKRIAGTVREPVSYFQKTSSNANWGKARATIDAPAARVLAYMFCQDSYASAHQHIKQHNDQNTLGKAISIPNSRSLLLVFLVRLGLAVSDRVVATWFAWREEADGSYVLAFAPIEEYADKERVAQVDDLISSDPHAATAIRATARGFWRFRPLAPNVCEVTYVVQVQLSGSIPNELLAMRRKKTLSLVQTVQDKYERKGRIVDAEMRAAFPNPPPLAELNEEQRSVVEGCRCLESEDGSEWETLASLSPFVTMWMKQAPAKWGERSIALGKATAVIDCPVHEAVGESSEASESRAARLAL